MIAYSDPEVTDYSVQAAFFYRPERRERRSFAVHKTMKDGRVIAEIVKRRGKLRSGDLLRKMAEVAWCGRELWFAEEIRLITEADIDPIDLYNRRAIAAARLVDATALGHVNPTCCGPCRPT
jgi:hypothetical protein